MFYDARCVCVRFSFGTRANVDKYIEQFRDILTDQIRPVKMTHHVCGKAPMVQFTQPTVPNNTNQAGTSTAPPTPQATQGHGKVVAQGQGQTVEDAQQRPAYAAVPSAAPSTSHPNILPRQVRL